MNTRFFHCQTVLVTGAAGFIGSHLSEKLCAVGARVIALDNLQAGAWKTLDDAGVRCERVEGDVRDYSLIDELLARYAPSVIFNLAANASVPLSVSEPRYDFEVNCGGTFALLERVRVKAPTTRVVLASSAAVYGEPGREQITEHTPVCPIAPYGSSKLAAEEQCRMFAKVYGTHAVIARLFNCYGPRMLRFVVLDFLKKLQQDPAMLEILGDGSQTRDFTFVSDTVAGLMVLAEHGCSGESYNVATGTSTSVAELATLLLRVLGLEGRTKLAFTGSSWKGDAQYWSVRIEKLRSLGFTPRVDLEMGLPLVVRWFQGQQS